MWEDLVGSVLPALALALLPEVLQAAVQAARGAQVKGVFLRDRVIQGGVVAVGMQPGIQSTTPRVSVFPVAESLHSGGQKKMHRNCKKCNFIIFLRMKS